MGLKTTCVADGQNISPMETWNPWRDGGACLHTEYSAFADERYAQVMKPFVELSRSKTAAKVTLDVSGHGATYTTVLDVLIDHTSSYYATIRKKKFESVPYLFPAICR